MTQRLFVDTTDENYDPQPVTVRIWNEFAVIAVIECHPQSGAIVSQARSPLAMVTPADIEMDPWAGLVRIVSSRFPGCTGPPTDFGPKSPFDDEPPF